MTLTIDQIRATMIGILGISLGTAGIVFSLLTVPFSVVVSQYGSRLLRIFMRDRTFFLKANNPHIFMITMGA